FFLPLLIGSSGNAGSQASTLVVRAMTTHDVEMKDWLKLFSKDFFVSLLLGVTMALIVSGLGFLRVGSVTLALVLAVAMLVNVIIGSIMGTLLPFILRLFRLDPAAASAPLIASLADISGVLIYFSVASLIL
ncbi:MAG: magnesium transporter, partial [Spirochaetae bacterium HGW-Spirochaetae-6]